MKQFEIGKTYSCRMTGDHTMREAWTVVSRTKKQVTLKDDHGKEFKRGVSISDDSEVCRPDGHYSFAPIIFASSPDV